MWLHPFLHVRLSQALFEYLLIMTGSKAGIDPSSPYNSLAEALIDSVGRKVGAVLEARRDRATTASVRHASVRLVAEVESPAGGVAASTPLSEFAAAEKRSAAADDRVVANPMHAIARSQRALGRPILGAGDALLNRGGFSAVQTRPR